MRRLLRRLRRLLIGLACLLLLVVGLAAGLLWQTLPGGEATLAIPGLTAPVTVTFDADEVPRLAAANELDAAAGLGFLHARERLFQMDMTRRAAAGELAEVIGTLGLPNDRMMRILGVRRSAEADLAAMDGETRAVLDAYARGVNAWIAARGRFAAPEYLALGAARPWSAVDSVLWGKMMGLYLSGNWRTELARASLLRRLPPDVVEALWPNDAGGAGRPEAALPLGTLPERLAAVVPAFPAPFTLPNSASDEWAVDGRHSASGAPLLAGDPHLGFAMPGTWYLARVDLPGRTLAGATAPGVPFMVVGHNGHIAWTFTTTGADVQDLFVETAAGTDTYMTPEGPKAFAIRLETIRIRGGAEERLTVRETRHGPVISDLVAPQGPLLAIAMANLAAGDTSSAGLLALNRAGTVAEAGAASGRINGLVQNLLVADRDGIGMFTTGRVPVRRGGDGSVPAKGADGSQDWNGLAGGEALPRRIAPESGRLVNGNERIAGQDFPIFLGRDWFGDWRARRIRELLGAAPKHTLASFAAMQVDAVSLFARDTLPRLAKVPPGDERARIALSLLAVWDGTMAETQAQPLIFNAWMRRFRRALLERIEVTDSAAAAGWELVAAALAREAEGRASLCGGPCDPLLSQSLTAAMADLAASQGETVGAWRWGNQHRAVFAHPLLGELPVLKALATRAIPVSGDDSTLLRAGMRGDSFSAVHGASFRAVYDLADLEHSRFVVTPGQSGNFASIQAWNFLRRWHDGGTIMLDGTPASVAYRLHLTP